MNVVDIEAAVAAKSAGPQPELTLVPASAPGERAIRLFLDARVASLEHLQALQEAMAVARDLAETVVHADGLYAVGLNDFAKRLSEDLFWRAKTLESLTERQLQAARGR